MNTEKALSKALGIETPKEVTNAPIKTEIQETEIGSNDHESDYSLSRNTFRNLISSGNRAIDNMTELAKESESPRAYEVLATLIKTVSESAKDLYDIHKKKKDLFEDKSKSTTDNINVDKAVFVGSTAELLARLKNREET